MKNFLRFLSEAKQSAASVEAKNKGLVYDSQRSGWMNPKTRELVARTEKGKLKFVTKRGSKGEEEAPSKEKTAKKPEVKSKTTKIDLKKSQSKPAEKKPETTDQEVATDTLTVTFGRFNPPTVGHGKLLSAAKKAAEGGDLKVYPSRSQDPKKNPLDPDMKISFMRKMFPEYAESIVNDSEMKTIFNVLVLASEDGYDNVNIVVGSDRQAEFENLATKYNGELYNFENIRVISAGVRDADAEGVEGMSASKMRKAVADGDFDSFRKGTPKELNDTETQSLFDSVFNGMKLKKKAVAETWEIAPKCDPKGLRENYVSGNIFNIGDIVENLNTGLVGKIIRRGTNHLICLTKEEYMFKSWIRDVMEVVVNYPGPSGVPSDQRLVGTDAHREYVQRMTGTFDIKNFINKYKKKTK